MDVGNQIGERRRALGLSQGELARRLYVSRVTVSRWETGRTLPDVQSMLLLANLFGTTIDELVRGDVDGMREMVEKGEQQRKAFAIALGAVEVTVIAVLAFMATAGRDYLDSALRLLLAVLVLASSVVTLVARRGGGTGRPRARQSFWARRQATPWRRRGRAPPPTPCDWCSRSSWGSPWVLACW
ncbi:helix-turn-helix transcriptional regulator [Collinsella tanakaei]|uniref:helix-turn-helix transcriptional regulator n=1 Tax=Collinsella tanakaei TaxID=626935 RepID=UPI001F2A1891|nr:helix-turn-helix transcriptional regulator [Collinsella tanakaei]